MHKLGPALPGVKWGITATDAERAEGVPLPLHGVGGAPAAPLPCQESHNSIGLDDQQLAGCPVLTVGGKIVHVGEYDENLELAQKIAGRTLAVAIEKGIKRGIGADQVTEALAKVTEGDRNSQGRIIFEWPDGTKEALGALNTSERKTAFALVENVKALSRAYGLERLGFLTLTFADEVTSTEEAQRRFNSACSNLLRDLFSDWIVVVEPQTKRRNCVHYHLLVVCQGDIRTGFDFEAAGKRDYRSASPYLRSLWSILRERLSNYGFGRHELLPIRKDSEAVADYVGKYLNKGKGQRIDGWEKARMVRYSRRTKWRAASSGFAWVESGRKWRVIVAQLAAVAGAKSFEDLAERFGDRWAYKVLAMLHVDPDISPGEIASFLFFGSRQPSTIARGINGGDPEGGGNRLCSGDIDGPQQQERQEETPLEGEGEETCFSASMPCGEQGGAHERARWRGEIVRDEKRKRAKREQGASGRERSDRQYAPWERAQRDLKKKEKVQKVHRRGTGSTQELSISGTG